MRSLHSALAFVLILLAAGCGPANEETTLSFAAHGLRGYVHTDPDHARSLPARADDVAEFLSRAMHTLDMRNPESDLARLNRGGSTSRMPMSPRTFAFIDMCRHYHAITDGAFDITTGGIAALWTNGIPGMRELGYAIDYSGMEFVDTSDNGSAILVKPGVEITPGHAMTAYALDLAVAHLKQKISDPLMIEIGMHARSLGRVATNSAPRLTIRIPEHLDNRVIGTIDFAAEKAVVNRVLPHRQSLPEQHRTEYVIDTRTGYPALGTRQVVVTGPLAIKAHALAEALLVLGRERGEAIMKSFPGYEIMLVPDKDELEIWMTPGFRKQFHAKELISLYIREWTPAESINAGESDPP